MGDLDLTKSDIAPPSQSAEDHVMELAKKEEAQILARVMVAQRVPRDVVVATTKMKELVQRLDMAKASLYSFRRGGSIVEGLSVNVARPMATLWGNISTGFQVLLDDGTRIKIKCYCWDMQTNTSIELEDSFACLIQRKGRGWIKPDERDKRELINRRAAIGMRNCILQVIPKNVVDAVEEQVRTTLSSKINVDIDKSRATTLTEFGKLGIKPQQLAVLLTQWRDGEAATIQDATPDEIRQLYGIFNSIRDGNSKWNEYIEQLRTTTVTDDGKNGLEAAGAQVGDPANHQSVKEALETEAKVELTDREKHEVELAKIVTDDEYNAVPGLSEAFKRLTPKVVKEMSDEKLATEIKNIQNEKVLFDKGQEKKQQGNKRTKLM